MTAKEYHPVIDARSLTLPATYKPNSEYSHPWMTALDKMIATMSLQQMIRVAHCLIAKTPASPNPYLTVVMGGHPNKLWYGYTLADMAPAGMWADRTDFVGWLPVHETTLLPEVGTYSIRTGETASEGHHKAALSIAGLRWNTAVTIAVVTKKTMPESADSIVNYMTKSPAAMYNVRQVINLIANPRNWTKGDTK